MKKKFLALSLCGLLTISALAGCSQSGSSTTPDAGLSVGMVTDSGTIDDKSFNQGSWEGITRAEKELGVSINYLKPTGTTEADYLKEISNLYDAGYKFIVTPGFKFETAIFKAQEKYSDAQFVLIDGSPHNGDGNAAVGSNTVSIFFAEHEAGFLAGIATALEQKTGDVGFIGGMEIPPVQRFNWGFQQGVNYANQELGTTISLKSENIVYQGSFDNIPAGQQLAAQMYDKGVKTIFCAAGGVGVGAINEAKERATKGDLVWIVGVDVDQYTDGIYADGKSVLLTSAIKKIDNSAFDMIEVQLKGTFPGGQTLVFDAKNDGIGLPAENPNLSNETLTAVQTIYSKIQNGEILIKAEQVEGLVK